MEGHQGQQQLSPNEDGGSSNSAGKAGGSGGFMSRQSSTRWTPTTDQIRILKDLYYNNGIRSPSAEQIQRISARLRQYGKIEGKNVFYWFQNHKARERQKKRFTTTTSNTTFDVPMQRPPPNTSSSSSPSPWKHDESPTHNNKFSNISITGVSSSTPSSSAGMVTMTNMGNYGYGSVPMEKSFRECSISATGGSSTGHVGGAINHSLGYFGMDQYQYSSAYSFFEKARPNDETMEEDQAEDHGSPEIQTLPLFPVHCEDIHGYCNLRSNSSNYVGGWYQSEDGFINNAPRASLELSLNSYARKSPDFS